LRYHILKIAPTPFFADYGCHVRILEEARVLQQRGHQVTVATYHTGNDLPDLPIIRIPPIPWHPEVRVGSHWHKLYFDLLLLGRVLAWARTHPVDIVHGHLHEGAFVGSFLSKVTGAPLVFDFQGSLTREMLDHNFLSHRSPLLSVFTWVERLINRLADHIITSSQNATELLIQEFGCSPERVTTVADCVDTERFQPRWASPAVAQRAADLRARLGIPPERQVVVFLGLLAEYQGISLLLEAARQVVAVRPDTHFLIMGYPGHHYYQAVAQGLGLGGFTTFTGRIPYAEAPYYLAIGDVAVSPKLSETEGNGKLLNYMACGLPTVSFRAPVSQEILGPDGVYAEYGSAASLAEKLLMLLDAPAEQARVGRALRARVVAEKAWAVAADRMLEVYAQAWRRRAGVRARTA
jgi:glycosyltransferase involved in cell wall biosynthesis